MASHGAWLSPSEPLADDITLLSQRSQNVLWIGAVGTSWFLVGAAVRAEWGGPRRHSGPSWLPAHRTPKAFNGRHPDPPGSTGGRALLSLRGRPHPQAWKAAVRVRIRVSAAWRIPPPGPLPTSWDQFLPSAPPRVPAPHTPLCSPGGVTTRPWGGDGCTRRENGMAIPPPPPDRWELRARSPRGEGGGLGSDTPSSRYGYGGDRQWVWGTPEGTQDFPEKGHRRWAGRGCR